MDTTKAAQPVHSRSLDRQYDSGFAEVWDDLIHWHGRQAAEGSFFSSMLRGHDCHTIIDLAAGTGYHAISLAEQGFDTTGVDSSAPMLQRARRNAEQAGVDVPFIQSDWRAISDDIDCTFDAALCLGSSLPHLIEECDRDRALRQFFALLKPGGLLVLDHRNFDSLLAGQFTSNGNVYYCGSEFEVNAEIQLDGLAHFTYQGDRQSFELSVHPLTVSETQRGLSDAGFQELELYGDFAPLEHLKSADFVIHAARRSPDS